MFTKKLFKGGRVPLAFKLFSEISAYAEKEGVPVELLNYRKDQDVFRVHQPAHYVYFLKSGLVKLMLTHDDGSESLVRMIYDGDFFGILSLNDQHRHPRTATPITSCEIYRLNRDFFVHTMQHQPELGSLFFQYLLEVIHGGEVYVDQLISQTVDQRLACVLLDHHKMEEDRMLVKLAKKDLSQMVGSIQSTISRVLAKMCALGWIDLHQRTIIIKNPEALKALSNKSSVKHTPQAFNLKMVKPD